MKKLLLLLSLTLGGLLANAVAAELQLTIPLVEGKLSLQPLKAKECQLGGPTQNHLDMTLDPEFLRRAALEEKTILSGALLFEVRKNPTPIPASSLELLFDGRPVASLELTQIKPGLCRFDRLDAEMRKAFASASPVKITLRINGSGSLDIVPPEWDAGAKVRVKSKAPRFLLGIVDLPKARNLYAGNEIRPKSGVYVKITDGHLTYEGKRLRLWGVCRHPTQNADTIRRMHDTGYNGLRLWGPVLMYREKNAAKLDYDTFYMPDGTGFENYDRCFAEAKKNGLFLISPSLHYNEWLSKKERRQWLCKENSFVSGGDDFPQWSKAFASIKDGRFRFFVYFDPRIQKIARQHAANYLNHRNPYTGKRYAEEEAIAIYEVYNENGFLKWTLEEGYAKWPEYFRKSLQNRWNEYLKEIYRTDEGVRASWGAIAPGESLAKNSFALEPLLGNRTKYPERRAKNFIRFHIRLVENYNRDFIAYCRSFAPKGIGVNAAPFVCDTLFRNSAPWGYVNSAGDVNAFGMYQSTLTSSLTVPPSLYIVDNNTLAGKPNIVYEINSHRPMPTRAEFPYRVAALASWQDWDGVFFHYQDELTVSGDARFMHKQQIPDEGFVLAPLKYPIQNAPDVAITHAADMVMSSALAAAGHLFRNGLLAPAKTPDVYLAGAKAIDSYDFFNGLLIRDSTFRNGSRISFRPDLAEALTRNGIAVDRKRLPAPSPWRTGNEQIYDWANGRLLLDSPRLNAYVGRTQNIRFHRFSDGFAFGDFQSPFVAVSLQSADNRLLAGENPSRKYLINTVSTGENKNFDFDWKIALDNGGFVGPRVMAQAIRNHGRAPVVYGKSSFTLGFPRRVTGTLFCYDFALREIARIALKDTEKVVVPGRAFQSLLDVERFGEKCDTTKFVQLAQTAGKQSSPSQKKPKTT
ncbi:MAG: hypothetical protein PHS41_08020, partial [Victivallaceae bacterium]|nr:hypothetical protein [Victivallaceae bacterium]